MRTSPLFLFPSVIPHLFPLFPHLNCPELASLKPPLSLPSGFSSLVCSLLGFPPPFSFVQRKHLSFPLFIRHTPHSLFSHFDFPKLASLKPPLLFPLTSRLASLPFFPSQIFRVSLLTSCNEENVPLSPSLFHLGEGKKAASLSSHLLSFPFPFCLYPSFRRNSPIVVGRRSAHRAKLDCAFPRAAEHNGLWRGKGGSGAQRDLVMKGRDERQKQDYFLLPLFRNR